jgi:hypothetical protein
MRSAPKEAPLQYPQFIPRVRGNRPRNKKVFRCLTFRRGASCPEMPKKTAFPRWSDAPAVFHSLRPHLSADLHAVFTDGRPITAAAKHGVAAYKSAQQPGSYRSPNFSARNRLSPKMATKSAMSKASMWVRSVDFAIFIPQCELTDSNVGRFGGLV